MCTVTAIFLIQPFFGFINLPVAIPVAIPIPISDHYPLLPVTTPATTNKINCS